MIKYQNISIGLNVHNRFKDWNALSKYEILENEK